MDVLLLLYVAVLPLCCGTLFFGVQQQSSSMCASGGSVICCYWYTSAHVTPVVCHNRLLVILCGVGVLDLVGRVLFFGCVWSMYLWRRAIHTGKLTCVATSHTATTPTQRTSHTPAARVWWWGKGALVFALFLGGTCGGSHLFVFLFWWRHSCGLLLLWSSLGCVGSCWQQSVGSSQLAFVV
jgi:hypothetical protein